MKNSLLLALSFILSAHILSKNFSFAATSDCSKGSGKCAIFPTCLPHQLCPQWVRSGYCTAEGTCVATGQSCTQDALTGLPLEGQYVVEGNRAVCVRAGQRCNLNPLTGLATTIGRYKKVNGTLTCVAGR